MKRLFTLTAILASMMLVSSIFMSRANAKIESLVGTMSGPIVVSHLDCTELLVVQAQAPAGLQGSTGLAIVQRPDGSTVSVLLSFVGYFGNSAKWSAPYYEYYNNQDGVYVVLSASVAGQPVQNTPYSTTVQGCVPLSVRVDFFEAVPVKYGGVRVSWQTATELDLLGFNVYRRQILTNNDIYPTAWTKVNKQFIPANAGSPLGQYYELIDSNVKSGSYEYLLEEVLTNGSSVSDWRAVVNL